jgi:hypothetical protein
MRGGEGERSVGDPLKTQPPMAGRITTRFLTSQPLTLRIFFLAPLVVLHVQLHVLLCREGRLRTADIAIFMQGFDQLDDERVYCERSVVSIAERVHESVELRFEFLVVDVVTEAGEQRQREARSDSPTLSRSSGEMLSPKSSMTSFTISLFRDLLCAAPSYSHCFPTPSRPKGGGLCYTRPPSLHVCRVGFLSKNATSVRRTSKPFHKAFRFYGSVTSFLESQPSFNKVGGAKIFRL